MKKKNQISYDKFLQMESWHFAKPEVFTCQSLVQYLQVRVMGTRCWTAQQYRAKFLDIGSIVRPFTDGLDVSHPAVHRIIT